MIMFYGVIPRTVFSVKASFLIETGFMTNAFGFNISLQTPMKRPCLLRADRRPRPIQRKVGPGW